MKLSPLTSQVVLFATYGFTKKKTDTVTNVFINIK